MTKVFEGHHFVGLGTQDHAELLVLTAEDMDHRGLVDLPANPHPGVLLDTLGQGLTDGTQAGDHLLWDFWSLCHADSLPRDTDFGSHRRDRDRAPRLEDERRPRAEQIGRAHV